MEIVVQNLSKAYDGREVLTGLSFTARAGITCIMAPSGGGKTTLLRILLGLEKPDSGTVETTAPCRWSAVFQENRLLEGQDALGNLRFVLGSSRKEREVQALLQELGLGNTEGKPVREYSGGMKRRLALARALLAPADALALDEPFAGLDEENRSRCREAILRETAGRPVILVTHDEEDVMNLNAAVVRL